MTNYKIVSDVAVDATSVHWNKMAENIRKKTLTSSLICKIATEVLQKLFFIDHPKIYFVLVHIVCHKVRQSLSVLI